MEKVINGHTYSRHYAGIVVYVVDSEHYYDPSSAAKALGLTVEEFKRVW